MKRKETHDITLYQVKDLESNSNLFINRTLLLSALKKIK